MTDKELYNPDEFLLDNIKEYHYEVMDEVCGWHSILRMVTQDT
jgi:hypothetical protein